MARYGQLYEDTTAIVLNAGLSLNALKLFIWITPYFKSGNRLKSHELAALEKWIAEYARNANPKAIQTVQFSLEHASSVFNGSKNEASRQVKRLVDSRVLVPVGKPSRGHSQLYIVRPIGYTSRCVPNDTGNGYTSRCVPNDKGNGYTSDSERVHIEGCLGTHAEAVSSDDETYPIVSSNNNPKGVDLISGEKETTISCPECGSTDVELVSTGMPLCRSCNKTWKMAG